MDGDSMKYSVQCLCGYATPLVEDKNEVDHDLLHAHQEFCQFKPHWGKGKTIAQLLEDEEE